MSSPYNEISGDAFDNELIGTTADDAITGEAGDDVLKGGNGNDFLSGGDGSDWLEGGRGNDILYGGDDGDLFIFGKKDVGHDEIYDFNIAEDQLVFHVKNDIVSEVNADFNGDGVTDTMLTLAMGDTVTLFGVPDFYEPYNTLLGNDGDNSISGEGTQDDAIFGGAGNDTLRGQIGNDMLSGGSGEDVLIGGRGNDVMYGGRDADTFVFGRYDTGDDELYDFNETEDVLQFDHRNALVNEVHGDFNADGQADTMLVLAKGSTITLFGVDDYLAF